MGHVKLSLFNHLQLTFLTVSLPYSPSENLLTDYQLISGSRCLRKVGSKQNTKTLGMWVLKVITRFKGNHVDDC